jgi:single-stranded-DNA-specific exonuclease
MSVYRLDTPQELPFSLTNLENRLATLLHKRGVIETVEIEKFLNPSYDDHLHDPFLLHDMDKATERIGQAIQAKEMIVIFSDYDCDGIPGAVVLYDFLTSVGHEKFFNHIPHRHYDGFGLSVSAVEAIKEKHNPALIITIDCGTTDLEAVERAREIGIDVIVTDHHEPKDTLPEAVAVVNPKVGDTYPFTGLCGAAVVFKLVQAMLAQGNYILPRGHEKWWLDMVGIATIADMVPLIDENRVLASYGLKVLRKSRRPGLQQLFRAQKAHQAYLTEDDVGFTIGPRINAASRMDTPEDAFWLLAVKDEGEAGARLKHLESLNKARKTAVAQMTREVHQRLGETADIPPVIVLGNPDWRPSLVGLAANKLAEENNRPAFLWVLSLGWWSECGFNHERYS